MSRNTQAALSSDNLGSRARTAIGWKALTQGLATGVLAVTSVLLARLLMPRDFGIVGMAIMVSSLVSLVQDLGLGQALVQRNNIEEQHLRAAFSGTLAMGVVLCAATVLAAPWVGAFFREPRMTAVLRVISLTFVVSPFGTVPRALLQRQLDFQTSFRAEAISGLIYAAVGITMALRGYGYWSLVAAQTSSLVAAVAALCIVTRYVPPCAPSFRGLRDLACFGAGVTGAGILNYVAGQADYFVVGRQLDAAALGAYTRAFTSVHQPFTALMNVLSPVLFPVFSRLRDDPGRARRLIGQVFAGTSLAAFPALGILAVAAPEAVPVVFGEQWRASILPMQVMAVAGMLRALVDPSIALTRGFGVVSAQVWRNGIYVVVLTIGAVAGSHWGIAGVACAALVATVVISCLNLNLLHSCSGFGARHCLHALRGSLLCTLGSVSAALATRHTLTGPHVPPLGVLCLTVAVGLAAAVLLALFGPFPETRHMARRMLRLAVRPGSGERASSDPG